jgi:hypothetical protein
MPSHTIKVTGVSDELLQLLDARVREQHSSGRAEYIRELIRRDVLGPQANGSITRPRSFREILGPVHEETLRQGYPDEVMDRDIEEVVREARAERRIAGVP